MGIDMNRKVARGACRAKAFAIAAICACLCIAVAVPAQPASAESSSSASGDAQGLDDLLSGCVDSLRQSRGVSSGQSIFESDTMVAGDSTCDWIAYDFARLQADDDVQLYLGNLEDSVTKRYSDTSTLLDPVMSTEWNRTSIVVQGLGGDPTSFGTDASGNAINLLSDGCYNWNRTNDLGAQGLNGYIYALEALDATGVKVPDDALYSKQQILDSIVAAQDADGGFALTGNSSDVDITAMALCALAPHQGENGVDEAIDKALSYLSSVQGDDGMYLSGGVANSESCSQVIMALSALQIDARTDSRFIKNGKSVFDALLTFRRDDGSFSHASDDDISKVSLLATEQATRALISMDELASGGDGDVYTADIALAISNSDADGTASESGSSPIPWVLGGIGIGAAIVAVAFFVGRARAKREDLEG